MSKAADAIWEFAIKNPDYWPLLVGDDEPSEVKEMDENRREAFLAARREVQRRHSELLKALWSECRARSKGSVAQPTFDKDKYGAKNLRAGILVEPFKNNKGKIELRLSDSGEGDLRLYASFWAAKKRQDQMRELMKSASADGEWLYYGVKIDPAKAADATAKGLVDLFFNDMIQYLQAKEVADD